MLDAGSGWTSRIEALGRLEGLDAMAHGFGNMLAAAAAMAATLGFGPCDVAKAQATGPTEVRIALIAREPSPPALYELDPVPEDEGLAGGRMAIQDNNTTGRFTGHHYSLKEVLLPDGADPSEAARSLVADGIGYIAAILPAEDIVKVADALKGSNAIVFNATAPDDRLRGADCRANVFHVVPSRAMLTDALGPVPRLQALATALPDRRPAAGGQALR